MERCGTFHAVLFIANLEPGHFTKINKWWLKNLNRILKKAKLNSIKQIRLVRLLKTNYLGNRAVTLRNSNEDVIYEAVTDANDSSYFVNLDQVYDIVGEEDWIHGEVNCLASLASSRTITLSWGAKKKESTKQRSVLPDESLQVGDHVVVENHGKHWPHQAQIIDIDMETNTASIRWETTRKDLKQFSLKDASPRKRKPTDFYNPQEKKIALNEQCQYDRSDLEGCMENIFYCEKNSSKLCAEGAIGNLMNMLHCPENDLKQFWDIVQSPVHLIQQTLGESCVPKDVLKPCGEIDLLKKVCGFYAKKSSLALQVHSEFNTFKTCKKRLIF